eukprot:COSAG01_NODE_2874_length_6937_cov_4.473823_10_plen_218_part_00
MQCPSTMAMLSLHMTAATTHAQSPARQLPRWNRPILPKICLCHAGPHHSIEERPHEDPAAAALPPSPTTRPCSCPTAWRRPAAATRSTPRAAHPAHSRSSILPDKNRRDVGKSQPKHPAQIKGQAKTTHRRVVACDRMARRSVSSRPASATTPAGAWPSCDSCRASPSSPPLGCRFHIQVRVNTMGSPQCRIVAESQSVLITISALISTRTRILKIV